MLAEAKFSDRSLLLRILFAAAGAYGHLYPIIPVARVAQQAGHVAAVATHPRFHSEVERAGLAAVAAGIPSVLMGVAQLPVQAILSTGTSLAEGALGDVPDNIEVVEWVPQAELLARELQDEIARMPSIEDALEQIIKLTRP